MTKNQTEQRIRQYFGSAPEPDRRAYEETVTLAVEAAVRPCPTKKNDRTSGSRVTLAPSVVGLVVSQARMTKGVVWILQAMVVVAALAYIAGADDKAAMLSAFGSASALLAGIGIAGIGFGKDQAVTEISYSCHFDYRQVVLARMLVYGLGDAAALGVLIGFGSLLLPDGFAAVAVCSGVSFFVSGFACMLALAHYQGESSMVLCGALSGSVAAFTGYAWSFHFEFLQQTNTMFWLVLAVGAACGIGYSARALIARIDAGFDHVSTRTD